MDAHVFRHISRILGDCLQGARLERVHEPVPGVAAFSLFAHGEKRCLMLRADRKDPLLFLTAKNPLPNPAFPPASVMRLRKHCEGRRLGAWLADWPNRRMAFAVPGPGGAVAGHLLLDLKFGPAFVTALAEGFGTEPPWPDPATVNGLSPEGGPVPPGGGAWQEFPVLTPALRRALACLDAPDRAALLVDLETGRGDLFWYMENGVPRLVSAWPLTPPGPCTEHATPPEAGLVLPLLEALQLPVLLQGAQTVSNAPAVKQDKADARRAKRRKAKLEAEKERLLRMAALGDDARLIKDNLWRLDPQARLDEICLSHEGDEKPRAIKLNSLLTLTENMQAMFKQAARGARGLAMLEERMRLYAAAPRSASPTARTVSGACGRAGEKSGKRNPPPSLAQEFVSSDGFTLWRGRSAEGNKLLLKLARPFDLWFHVEDGPSAHLILRREHEGQEVPERTLEEAAILTGLKSWRRDEAKASVMVALTKHVHAVKGAPAGTVSVHQVWKSLTVALERDTERRLVRGVGPSADPAP